MAKRRRFRHLSWNDRLRIEAFLKCGKSVQEIADEIGVHRNTIYNELKRGRYTHRNSDWTEEERYSPDIAEAAYREHLAAKGPDLKIGKDYRLAEYIERRIVEDGYSPASGPLTKSSPKVWPPWGKNFFQVFCNLILTFASAGFNIRLCKGQRPSHSLIFLCGGPGYEENDRSENA